MSIIDNIISTDHINLNIDLCPYYSGIQDCEPGHYYGPAVRDHYLIHFILEGKGIFEDGKNTYHLTKGQGFLICPGKITFYKADTEEPWIYVWVGFHGLNAENYLERADLSLDNPVFTCKPEESANFESVLRKLVDTKSMKKGKDLMSMSLLYHFISLLIESGNNSDAFLGSENRKDFYVRKAVEFIQMNYSRQMSIEEMAGHIGLDRKYLSSVFKEVLKVSPHSYLLKFRINKACELLKSRDISIGDVARSVGYEDPLLFSRMFKKVRGYSPKFERNRCGDASQLFGK